MANFPYIGTSGNDNVFGAYDLMYGDGGDDILTSNYSNSNVDVVISGGDGDDRLDLDDASDSDGLLFGDSGSDTIDGGSESDHLFGGSGNDLLTGWTGSFDYLYGGSGNDKIYGFWFSGHPEEANDVTDYLFGGVGNDRLFGNYGGDDLHGGTGRDILTGGPGDDEFWFDTKPNATTNVDKVKDFNSADDIFSLGSSTFDELPVGPLAPGAFRTAKKAIDGDDHLIYDQAEGLLYFDPDGKGGDPQVLLARLVNHAAVSYVDFYVVPV
jgi:Ca2+-binding RTX toxin-like protein